MSSNERWGRVRIVDEYSDEEIESNGLQGAIRNALERGENIPRAKQSLINAGYNQKDVEIAARSFSQDGSGPVNEQQYYGQYSKIGQPQAAITKTINSGNNKTLIILLIVVSLLILTGAAILILFWSKIFG